MLSTNWCCQCYWSTDAADVTDIVAHVRRILGEEEEGEKWMELLEYTKEKGEEREDEEETD